MPATRRLAGSVSRLHIAGRASIGIPNRLRPLTASVTKRDAKRNKTATFLFSLR
jgi:hypothetical protein